ncbi:hypothetical protein [Actinoplanes aureus]|nr:hypothetical protein [Actinoplanes aureus]
MSRASSASPNSSAARSHTSSGTPSGSRVTASVSARAARSRAV